VCASSSLCSCQPLATNVLFRYKSQGITSLDVVIANAGIFNVAAFVPVADVKVSQLQEHLDVNAVGPVRLFQATRPLLAKSANPRFVLISSVMGSITSIKDFTFYASSYGTSKAAANYLVRTIHFENDNIAALAIHPG
jgi:norsolorinic acid ketoreductase